ncbi:uncharacterized protein LOC119653190 [Hermetia illucens]|uniref:uncharacterized protein LOC119653190 n=1 Tax=Hermetia illucens TaxID=343691 RepID=UPI0018CC4B3D|nr:uncharacterized protein LOC119653190 [Hermetia illucens]
MALSISLSRKSSSLEFDEIEDTYEKYAGGETIGALIIDDRINYIRDECDQFAAVMFGKGADKLEDNMYQAVLESSENLYSYSNKVEPVVGFTRNELDVETKFLRKSQLKMSSNSDISYPPYLQHNFKFAGACLEFSEASPINDLFAKIEQKIQNEMETVARKTRGFGESIRKYEDLRAMELPKLKQAENSVLNICRKVRKLECELMAVKVRVCTWTDTNPVQHFCCKKKFIQIYTLQKRLEKVQREAIQKRFDLKTCEDANARLRNYNGEIKECIKKLLKFGESYWREICKIQDDVYEGKTKSSNRSPSWEGFSIRTSSVPENSIDTGRCESNPSHISSSFIRMPRTRDGTNSITSSGSNLSHSARVVVARAPFQIMSLSRSSSQLTSIPGNSRRTSCSMASLSRVFSQQSTVSDDTLATFSKTASSCSKSSESIESILTLKSVLRISLSQESLCGRSFQLPIASPCSKSNKNVNSLKSLSSGSSSSRPSITWKLSSEVTPFGTTRDASNDLNIAISFQNSDGECREENEPFLVESKMGSNEEADSDKFEDENRSENGDHEYSRTTCNEYCTCNKSYTPPSPADGAVINHQIFLDNFMKNNQSAENIVGLKRRKVRQALDRHRQGKKHKRSTKKEVGHQLIYSLRSQSSISARSDIQRNAKDKTILVNVPIEPNTKSKILSSQAKYMLCEIVRHGEVSTISMNNSLQLDQNQAKKERILDSRLKRLMRRINDLTAHLETAKKKLGTYRTSYQQLVKANPHLEEPKKASAYSMDCIQKHCSVKGAPAIRNDVAKINNYSQGNSSGQSCKETELSEKSNLSTLIASITNENESYFRDYLEYGDMIERFQKELRKCVQELTRQDQNCNVYEEPRKHSDKQEWISFAKNMSLTARNAKLQLGKYKLGLKMTEKELKLQTKEKINLQRKLHIYATLQRLFLAQHFGPPLKIQIKTLSKSVEKYKGLAEDYKRKKKDLTREKDEIANDLKMLKSRLEDEKQELETLTNVAAEEVRNVKQQNDLLIQELEAEKSEKRQLVVQLENSHRCLEECQSKLKETKSELLAVREVKNRTVQNMSSEAENPPSGRNFAQGLLSANPVNNLSVSSQISFRTSIEEEISHSKSMQTFWETLQREVQGVIRSIQSHSGKDDIQNELTKINRSIQEIQSNSNITSEKLVTTLNAYSAAIRDKDPQLYGICIKMVLEGIDYLDFSELIYLHYAVYNAGLRFRKKMRMNQCRREIPVTPPGDGHHNPEVLRLQQLERDMNKTQEILRQLQRQMKES